MKHLTKHDELNEQNNDHPNDSHSVAKQIERLTNQGLAPSQLQIRFEIEFNNNIINNVWLITVSMNWLIPLLHVQPFS